MGEDDRVVVHVHDAASGPPPGRPRGCSSRSGCRCRCRGTAGCLPPRPGTAPRGPGTPGWPDDRTTGWPHRLSAGGPVGREVVLAAQPVVIHPGDIRRAGIQLRRLALAGGCPIRPLSCHCCVLLLECPQSTRRQRSTWPDDALDQSTASCLAARLTCRATAASTVRRAWLVITQAAVAGGVSAKSPSASRSGTGHQLLGGLLTHDREAAEDLLHDRPHRRNPEVEATAGRRLAEKGMGGGRRSPRRPARCNAMTGPGVLLW